MTAGHRVTVDYGPSSSLVICICGYRDILTTRQAALNAGSRHLAVAGQSVSAASMAQRARHARVLKRKP